MKTAYRRPSNSSIPGYSENAVLQLIVASGVGYVAYSFTEILLKVAEASPGVFINISSNIVLPPIKLFILKFWTVFTYGWVHNGFWDLFTNMVWLYSFGSVFQALVGYRQVIPLFIYSLIIGGVFFELSQLLPGDAFIAYHSIVGSQAAITALAVAALTVAPGYRFHLASHFSIPLIVIAIIFFGLMILNSNLEAPVLCMLAGGALSGFGYAKLLQNGNQPGMWMYRTIQRADGMVQPRERNWKQPGKKRSQVLDKMDQNRRNTESRIDEILDKINQQGYNSLTKEEKEILMKAGKDSN